MFKKNKKNALKAGKPKYSDLKEIVTQVTVSADIETVKNTFKFALPEIGRQIAKSNNYYGNMLVKASGIASSIVQKIDDVTPNYHGLRHYLATELGFAEQSWQVDGTAQCYQRVDLEDLYDNHDLEVELHVVVTRKPISKEQALAKYGIK
jgi:hypothetical protein